MSRDTLMPPTMEEDLGLSNLASENDQRSSLKLPTVSTTAGALWWLALNLSETTLRLGFVEPGQLFLQPSTFEDVQSNLSDSLVYWWTGYAFNQTLWEAWSDFLALAVRSSFSIRWEDEEVFNIHPCFSGRFGVIVLGNRRDSKTKCSVAFKKAFLSSPAFLVSSSEMKLANERKKARCELLLVHTM